MEDRDDAGIPAAPFTSAEARAVGISRSQLRNKGVEGISYGLYRPEGWVFELRSPARALCAAAPGAWISHVTAATLHELVLPPRLSDSHALHFSKPRALPQIRRKGVSGHRATAFPEEVDTNGELRISTRARTWLDMAGQLSLPELVCMGDQLIRIPRPDFEDREAPYATLTRLRAMVDRHKNFQGIVRARAALEHMRVGADSAPESLLRLAMLDAGLPEPELQLKLWDGHKAPSADVATDLGESHSNTTAPTILTRFESTATGEGTRPSKQPDGPFWYSRRMTLLTVSTRPFAASRTPCGTLGWIPPSRPGLSPKTSCRQAFPEKSERPLRLKERSVWFDSW